MQLGDRRDTSSSRILGSGAAARILFRLHQRARRALAVAGELAAASFNDRREDQTAIQRVWRTEPGAAPRRPDGRVAIYAHYSPANRVHPMVLRQLDDYAKLGFDIVFVTMCRDVQPTDCEQVRRRSVLLIMRRSFGRDFGAWKDAWAPTRQLYPEAEELLLTNDSVLGPIRPLEPILERMRMFGPGLIGLTESRQGPRHLQSYFLLASGPEAVSDVGGFLAELPLSSSRWLMVRRGEYGLTDYMQRRGHAVASLIPDEAIADLLPLGVRARPINPTHHGWRALVEHFGFPFIKTDLLVRNPNRLPRTTDWASLLQPGVGIDASVIAEYLAQAGEDIERQ